MRLARMLHGLLPDDPEVTGLLALMLLTDARRAARTGPHGELFRWGGRTAAFGTPRRSSKRWTLITEALLRGPAGPYQLQAPIGAIHDEAPNAEATDWPQIVALYEVLMGLSDNPVVALNHAVAVAMAQGPERRLALLARLQADDRIAQNHRVYAVRAHLLGWLAIERARGAPISTQ